MTDDVRACPHGDLPCSCTDGTRPWLFDEGAWPCGRGHTERQPNCPACHDVAYTRMQAAKPTVTIDAELLDLIITILHETFYDGVNYPVDVGGVLEQLKAAREGR